MISIVSSLMRRAVQGTSLNSCNVVRSVYSMSKECLLKEQDETQLRLASNKVKGDIIGIDLGTTNSCVAVMEGENAKVLKNSEGERLTPSQVAFTKGGERLVGMPAKRQTITNAGSTFYATKRLIGRQFNDPSVQSEQEHLSYEIVQDKNGSVLLRDTEGRLFTPVQIAAFILMKMKDTAKLYLNRNVENAVITVPAYFNDSQRQATKDAGEIAGLNVLRVINEPTAAALAYGMHRQEDAILAVYDLGGGTFDISILEMREGTFEVKSTNGNTSLGGEDFDNRIVKYLIQEFKEQNHVELPLNKLTMQRLKEAAEKAKCELSTTQSTTISLPYLHTQDDVPYHLNVELSRSHFGFLVTDLIEKTMLPCEKALQDAQLNNKDVAAVLLVGGMTRMPRVQHVVKKIFKSTPLQAVNPDEAVALGAAVQASILTGELTNVMLVEVTPLSLGIETIGGLFTRLIPRNSKIPTRKSAIFSTAMSGQSQVDVRVYQGERDLAANNKLLGAFTLFGLRPAPRGGLQIEVVFDIDDNGIVKVSARDLLTGKVEKIALNASGNLSEAQISEILQKAQENAQRDRKERAIIDVTNQAEAIIEDTEHKMDKFGSTLSQQDVESIKEEIQHVRQMISAKTEVDADEVRRTYSQLQQKTTKIFEKAFVKVSASEAADIENDDAHSKSQDKVRYLHKNTKTIEATERSESEHTEAKEKEKKPVEQRRKTSLSEFYSGNDDY